MPSASAPFDTRGPGADAPGAGPRGSLARLYRRDLAAYPATGRRMSYLAIVVVTTVVLYYMLYIQYAVATSIITHFDMTYRYFVWVSVIGNAVGAFASLVGKPRGPVGAREPRGLRPARRRPSGLLRAAQRR